MSDDRTGIKKILEFVTKKYKSQNINFDEVWLIYATNPFINKKTIINCKKIFKKKIAYKPTNALMTVTSYNYPVQWAQKLEKNNKLKPLFLKKILLNSQEITKTFCDAGIINIYKSKAITENLKVNYYPYKLQMHSSVDIDDVNDFNFAKKLLNRICLRI